MFGKSSHGHYHAPIIVLHWLTLVLIIAIYVLMEFKGIFPKYSPGRESMKNWHYTIGMTIFVLTLLRLLLHFGSRTPPIVPRPPRWQMALARLMHLALLAFLVLMPLSGWLMMSAAGKAIPFWGFDLPTLVGQNGSLARNIKELHEFIATAGYFLIGAHALAALYHHYFMNDNTLRRMTRVSNQKHSHNN